MKPARGPAAAGIDQPARTKSKTPKPAEAAEGGGLSRAAIRETVESVVIAFVLAFLFRTFEAEAFVIPTGSMATTLMGRHKDLECPVCGHKFQVSASDEEKGASFRVMSCTCPMCRSPIDVSNLREYDSFNGDRILVGKFAYQFSDPERWDVAVFHYPGEAQTNYIKRVVGLPGETIRIQHGDIYAKGAGDADFTIARKTADKKLQAMLRPVYDNDLAPKIEAKGWPARWTAWPRSAAGSIQAWKSIDDGRAFETGGYSAETWIRYEHRIPSPLQWAILNGQQVDVPGRPEHRIPKTHPWAMQQQPGHPPNKDEVLPSLISDFSGYNTEATSSPRRSAGPPLHWVGDLALRCTVESNSDEGQAILELVKGGRHFQCRFDLESGNATLSIGGKKTFRAGGETYNFSPTVKTAVRGKGRHEVMFSNCDEELRLWVDGCRMTFDESTKYPSLDNYRPTDDDLAPVGIGSLGAALTVSHLTVLRDIYYINVGVPRWDSQGNPVGNDGHPEAEFEEYELSSPATCAEKLKYLTFTDYKLGADEFFMLGDNSPKSKDGRLWDGEHFVKRELLIGKAFFIYWPHSWDSPIPFWPNVKRMGFVR